MNTDEINEEQKNSLTQLRFKIEQSKKNAEEANRKQFSSEAPALILRDVPFYSFDELEDNIFSVERHRELCSRVDILFCNYLYYKEKLNNEVCGDNVENFEQSIKSLAQEFEELISFGLTPRF